jgi:sulfide:quinone oxidoreductase
MPDRIVILGGGTGGTLTANRLRRRLGDSAEITVVDRDDRHVYQPGLLFVPFGLADHEEIVRCRQAQLHDGIEFRLAEVERVDTTADAVHLNDGTTLPYDVLVVASGARLLPGETEGLTGPSVGESVFDFYTLAGAIQLRRALRSLRRGRLVVNIVDLPIKCPVAPLEFCFLADWYLRERGLRRDIDIVYVTPLDAAFTKPLAARRLASLLEVRQIEIETEFATAQVDGEGGQLVSWDDRAVDFDLLVSVPLHAGAAFVDHSPGLGDEIGFVEADKSTLQSRAAPNVFAIGDATDAPTSKAGSVTHFEGDTVVANVCRHLAGQPLQPTFDGHTNCFVETGFHRALLIDFNYDVEPLPGRYPQPHLGPLPLLRESHLNHMAKLAFQWVYWHVLLPGHELPGVGNAFQLAGKDTNAAPSTRSPS